MLLFMVFGSHTGQLPKANGWKCGWISWMVSQTPPLFWLANHCSHDYPLKKGHWFTWRSVTSIQWLLSTTEKAEWSDIYQNYFDWLKLYHTTASTLWSLVHYNVNDLCILHRWNFPCPIALSQLVKCSTGHWHLGP